MDVGLTDCTAVDLSVYRQRVHCAATEASALRVVAFIGVARAKQCRYLCKTCAVDMAGSFRSS